MAISQAEFEGLDPNKHTIVDGGGRSWEVQANHENDGGDVPGKREVWLKLGDSRAQPFGWFEGNIIDEQLARDVDLNHPATRVLAK